MTKFYSIFNLIHYKYILLISFFSLALIQDTSTQIYTEDFSGTDVGVGCTASCTTPADNNWSLTVVGSPDLDNSGDQCVVTSSEYLEWKDIDGSPTDRVDWYSQTISSPATGVSISMDYDIGRASSSLKFYYKIDGGAWVLYDTKTGTVESGSVSVTGLAFTATLELKVEGYTANFSTGTCYIDNVSVTGTTCTPPATFLTLTTDTACDSETSVTISGGSPVPGGGQTGTYSASCGACLSGTTFDPSVAGIGTHTITYSFDDGSCVGTASDLFTVIGAPNASIVSTTSDLCDSNTRTLAGSPAGGTFIVTSGPATVSGDLITPSGAGTVNIEYTYNNGTCSVTATQSFNIITSCSAPAHVGSWDALNFDSESPCTWVPQDGQFLGSSEFPYASWEAGLEAADNNTNATIQLLPDVYVGSHDYDNDGNNESCSDAQIADVYMITSADNGLSILGVDDGCGSILDLSQGGSTTKFSEIGNVDGLTIKDVYFKSYGGILQMDGATNVQIVNCVFDNSDNAVNAVLIDNSTNITFINCTFINSLSTSGFKQLKVTGTSNNVTFNGCSFSCNQDPGDEGGAVLVECDGLVDFNDCVFTGNISNGTSGDGGAMRIKARTGAISEPTVNFRGGTFCNNSSESTTGTVGGGALHISEGLVSIDGTNFYGNTAVANGGAIIFKAENHPLVVKNATFEANTSVAGGAIYIGRETTVEIDNCYFTGNDATVGGAIYINAGVDGSSSANPTTISISNTTVTSNMGGGAAVHIVQADNNENSDNSWLNSDAITVSNSNFSNNTTTGTYADYFESYHECSFCAYADPATTVDASTVIVDGAAVVSSGSPTTSLNQGDPLGTSAGWTGTYVQADCATVDCTSPVCALVIPGSCYAANYSETSSAICTDPTATASLSGQIWIDANEDGIQQAGEIGGAIVTGVVVQLIDANGYNVGFTTTDANGNYSFTGLPAGDYTVRFQNPDRDTYFSLTDKDASAEDTDSDANSVIASTLLTGSPFILVGGEAEVTLASGENKTDVDAGFIASVGSIAGTVFNDDDNDGNSDTDPTLNNVQVTLYSCGDDGICGNMDDRLVEQVLTSGTGDYSFNNLPLNIDYYVEFDDTDGTATNYTYTSQLNAGDFDAANNDSDASPVDGKSPVITLTNTTPDVMNIDAGLTTNIGSLAGNAFQDMNDDGDNEGGTDPAVANITVILYYTDGTEAGRTTTDGSGNYSFPELPYNTYYVGFSNNDGVDLYDYTPQLNAGDYSAATNDSDANVGNGNTSNIIINAITPNITDVNVGFSSTTNPLPVELIGFSIDYDNCNAILNWSTASEENTSHFTIQKSVNGKPFVDVINITAVGNSTEVNSYSHRDEKPDFNTIYRLKIVDWDETFEYSNLISFQNKNCNEELSINNLYPNPTKNNLNLILASSSQKDLLIKIFDVSGKVISEKNVILDEGNNQISLKTSELPNGIYFLNLYDNSGLGEMQTIRFVKF